MKERYHAFAIGSALLGLALGAGPVAGQAPTISSLAPGRNALNAPRTGAVALTFSRAVTGASSIRVFGNQWRGSRAGAAGGDGTTTLRVQPSQVFAPGEEVSVTVPATVRGAAPGGSTLAAGQVLQFRAAAGPGLGMFRAGTRITGLTPSIYREPNLADMNGDGRLDLLYFDPTFNSVYLRLGDGLGAFGLETHFNNQDPEGLLVADFNNDGQLDVVTNVAGSTPWSIELRLGNGLGGFSFGAALPLTALPYHVQSGDVNADGNLDLVFIEYLGTTTLGVRLGDGRGGFSPLASMPLTAGTGGLRVVDANNDGYLDCLVANGITGLLYTYLGNGQGTFALAATPPLAIPVVPVVGSRPSYESVLPVAADLTGDGNVDALVLDLASSAVRLHPGTGLGGFGPATVLTSPDLAKVNVADVDGDGDLDLLLVAAYNAPFTTNPNREVKLRLNNGSGIFTAPTILAGPATQTATGDINNDGALDVVLLDERGTAAGPGIYPFMNQLSLLAPTIGAVSPVVAPAGTTVTITGMGLVTATAVLVGGVAVTGFTVNPTTGAISFVVPVGSAGGLITIITPTGSVTSPTPLQTTLAVRPAVGGLAVQLYPNPAQSTVQVLLPANTPAGLLQATFYNSLGQGIHTAVAPVAAGRAAELDLRGLAPGLYTLRLLLGQHTSIQQLVVE
jgi:hypothetical protein